MVRICFVNETSMYTLIRLILSIIKMVSIIEIMYIFRGQGQQSSCSVSAIEKFFVVNKDDPIALNYLQQISEDRATECLTTPWGSYLMKNCLENGDLMDFSSVSEYEKSMKDTRKSLWLLMKLKVFQLPTHFEVFGIFLCPQCKSMSTLGGIGTFQSPEDIKPKLCFHSLVASMVTDWRSTWSVSLSPRDEVFDVCLNQEQTCTTFITQSAGSPLLAGVIDEGNKVSILYCATARQEVPYCTSCVRRKCHHLKRLLASYSQPEAQVQGDEEMLEEDYDPKHDVEENNYGFEDHYLIPLPKHVHGFLYGFNFEPIYFPFSESSNQQEVWLDRKNGLVNIPDRLVPEYDAEYKCKHNLTFIKSDESLVRESQTVCLFNDLGERIMKTEVFARPSEGPCKCLHRVDGNPYLIWNLGHGRFIDYTLLLGYLHKWRVSGISMHALYKSIVDCAESCGVACSLTYADVHRGVCGFFINLKFNIQTAFSCPDHGSTPSWIVADGKALGPLKKRVKHLTELDVAKDDKSVLEQSTFYKDRIFLSSKKERGLVIKVLTGDITMTEFTLSNDIKSDNGVMIMDLVRFMNEKYPQEIPSPYLRFLKNISKNSSARSLVQVNEIEILEDLSEFCREELDVRVIENEVQLKRIVAALPALWPIIDDICFLEKSKFLPVLVSRIILRILKIRFETFAGAPKRSNSQYFSWTGPTGEHPTQCYPLMPLWRYPSKYRVSDQGWFTLCPTDKNKVEIYNVISWWMGSWVILLQSC